MNYNQVSSNDKKNTKKVRIGILGGTFDPIHDGHLMIAKEAMAEYDLSKVFLIPTGVSYMKTGVTDSYFRYEMTKLAAEDIPGFVVSDVEIRREGNTYTCDTIQYYKEQYPDAKIYFIIGTDSLFSIEKWRNSQYIFENCTILCATRVEDDTEEQTEAAETAKARELNELFDADISFVHCTPIDVSSTEIRKCRKRHANDCPETLPIPRSVADYIYRHDLYDEKTEKIHLKLKEDEIPEFNPDSIFELSEIEDSIIPNKKNSVKLEGKLDGEISVLMNLYDLEGGKGEYYYLSEGEDKKIKLKCKCETNNQWRLLEVNDADEIKGVFVGKLEDGIFIGKYVSQDGQESAVTLFER